MECVSCRGKGCPDCGNRGRVELRGCPKHQVSDEAIIVLQVLDSECLPVTGGYLDQTQWYANARSYVAGEENHWRKVKKNGNTKT